MANEQQSEEATSSQISVLIYAPTGRDAQGACTLLNSAGIHCQAYASFEALCGAMDENTGALLIAEEALHNKTLKMLSDSLAQQPIWSDLPVLILTLSTTTANISGRNASARLAEMLGNIMFLERPLHKLTLVSAVHSALKARKRQYQSRDLLIEREYVAQELFKAKELAEEANQRKSEFLARMSHELRTPLNAVIGYSEMMQLGMTGVLSEKQDRYVNNIVASGKHLLSMVNDLLDVAKIEAGKFTLTIDTIDPLQFTADLKAIFEGLADKKKVSLSIELDPSLEYFNADLVRLKQIFFNLISNAIKFNRSGGSVTIRLLRDEEWMVGEVGDTGIGIAEDKIPELFQEFYQVDTRTTRQYEGTGLGLVLCRHLVNLHGGSISVQSQLGAGTTFRFQIPLFPVLTTTFIKEGQELSSRVITHS